MAFQYTSYALPYALAILINLALVARLWRYRDRRAAPSFLFDITGIILLSVCNGLQLLSTDIGAKLFWWNWRFVAISFMGVGYMLTAVEYTNREHWITYKTGAAIAAIPALSQVFVWTNESHGLFYGYTYDAAANMIVPQFNPLYWLWAGAIVAYLGIGIYLLLDLVRKQVAFTRQATILLGTILLVLVGEVLWWTHLVPIDPAPLTSTVKVAGFLFGVARFDLLDIVPVARNKVIENMRDAVFVVDRTDRIVDVNQAGKRLVAEDTVVRKSIDEVFDPGTLPHDDQQTRTDITLTVDGEERHFDFQTTPLTNTGGAGDGRLFVFRDITELKNREEELSILNRLVRHDIRNDMSVISGRGEILSDHVDPAGAEHLRKIRKTSEHVVELTDNVGRLMESVTSAERMEVEPTNLPAMLDAQLEQARMRHDDAQFTVVGSLPQSCQVQANQMLSSVFTNLFNNAVAHNDKKTSRVDVSVTETASTVQVEIADNGPGIPDERKDEVFGRGEKGLNSSGTGIGLYLVDTLVTHYGGDVSVADNDPEGTVFTIELPLVSQTKPRPRTD